jgi:CubicO group peptidase (beta-lactamase class C family)
MKEMPSFIKWILRILIFLILVVIALKVTDNGHILNAFRSTYLIGRIGPDIDNHKFFTQRIIANGQKLPWKKATEYNSHSLTAEDSAYFKEFETVSYLVVQKGEILYEYYDEGYSDTSLVNSFSMAKSIVSMLVGIAIDEGKIKSVMDKASDYLTELKGTDKEEVTIEQLLQMTSGIGFDESYGNPFGFMSQAYYGDDLYNRTLAFAQNHEPGTTWEYLGGNTLMLSFIVEKATRMTLSEYMSKKLWRPIGAGEPAQWTYEEESGVERSYCCFYSNARDFARIGQLMLCDGNWYGEQLISPQWVDASMTPCRVPNVDGKPVDNYGYQWWLMKEKGQDVEYMRGILGQYVFIIPEKELVVVRLGHQRSLKWIDKIPADIFEYLAIANRIAP